MFEHYYYKPENKYPFWIYSHTENIDLHIENISYTMCSVLVIMQSTTWLIYVQPILHNKNVCFV